MFPMRVPINYGALFARTARYKLEIDCYVCTFLLSLHIQTNDDSSLPGLIDSFYCFQVRFSLLVRLLEK